MKEKVDSRIHLSLKDDMIKRDFISETRFLDEIYERIYG